MIFLKKKVGKMWLKTITYKELKEQARWKVELFTTSEEKIYSKFEMVKLRTLLKERKENSNPFNFPNQTFNYIGLENIIPATGELLNFSPKKGSEIKSRAKVFYPGDILFGRLRPYLNKVYLAVGEIETGICSGEFHVLVPDYAKVQPYYLRAVLSSEYIQKYVKSMQTGSALPRLGLKDLLEMEIPLPPYEVQHELEGFLFENTSRLVKLRKELNTLPEKIITNVENILKTGFVTKKK